jgi:hypothetical protein
MDPSAASSAPPAVALPPAKRSNAPRPPALVLAVLRSREQDKYPVATPQTLRQVHEIPRPSDRRRCLFLIKRLLLEWELACLTQSVPPNPSLTDVARQATRRDLKPLLRALRDDQTDPGLLDALHTCLMAAADGEHRSAQEKYFALAIGNARWPIGVSALGIHARVAHAKIAQASGGSHVLESETKRRYIQGIKRLLDLAALL